MPADVFLAVEVVGCYARNKANAGEATPSACLDVVCASCEFYVQRYDGWCVSTSPVAYTTAGLDTSRPWSFENQHRWRFHVEGRTMPWACAFIVPNHLGEPVLAGAGNISPALDVLSAETMAMPVRTGIGGTDWHLQDRVGNWFQPLLSPLSVPIGDRIFYTRSTSISTRSTLVRWRTHTLARLVAVISAGVNVGLKAMDSRSTWWARLMTKKQGMMVDFFKKNYIFYFHSRALIRL